MGDLTELLARVKAATGPDRELECDLIRRFVSANEADYHFTYSIAIYRVTESIDAALALVERMLPGWGIEIGRPAGRGGIGNARLYPGDERNAELTFFGMGETPALAILASLLSALNDEGKGR